MRSSRGRVGVVAKKGFCTCMTLSLIMFMAGLFLGALDQSSLLLLTSLKKDGGYLAEDAAFPLYREELESQTLTACDVYAVCQGAGMGCGMLKGKGCKHQVHCGNCMFPETCGGSGTPNVCGCKPVSCSSLKRTCGEAPDGCGGNLTCGDPCEVPMLGRRGVDLRKRKPAKPYRVGYFQYSAESSERFGPETIEAGLFSHIVYKSGTVDLEKMNIVESVSGEDNKGDHYGAWMMFSNVSHAFGAIPIISLSTNVKMDSQGLTLLPKLAGFASSRTLFARHLVDWMAKYEFRGVEFTWECIPGLNVEGGDLANTMKDIRKFFNERGKKDGVKYWLTLSVMASDNKKDYVGKSELKRTVDWISLRPWSTQGEQAKVSSMLLPNRGSLTYRFDAALAFWTASVGPGKILLGLPAFATLWHFSDDPESKRSQDETAKVTITELPYHEIIDRFADQSSVTGSLHPSTLTVQAKQGLLWASYEDPRTVSLKVDYVVQHGLLGYGIWTINSDKAFHLARAASERTLIPQPVPYKRGKVVIVSSGYTNACKNKEGDSLLGRSLRNKISYAQQHGYGILYNVAEINPNGMWTKQPLFKHLLRAHRDVEWFFWVDGDAFFTDVKHPIPFEDYEPYDLIVPGYGNQLLENERPNWCLINAGVFLIRNTPWALNFMDEWWEYGNPDKKKEYGELFTKALSGRDGMSSDDQSALAYMLITNKTNAAKTFFENRFALHGYWKYHVGKYQSYFDDGERTEHRHVWNKEKWSGKQPPFMSHFVGCKMCSSGGYYNQSECFTTMDQALNFAEDQILLQYRLQHKNLDTPELMRFSFPDVGPKSLR